MRILHVPAAGLVFHQRKHARESGHVPAVESLKNTKLPAIPTEVKAAHRGDDPKRVPVSADLVHGGSAGHNVAQQLRVFSTAS
jgi:hypothetical protein